MKRKGISNIANFNCVSEEECVASCFDDYDVVDLTTSDEETYLMNLQPKQGPLSLYNSESKGDGEKRKPVCLVKLMRGVCTRQDCSFDHSREALLRGKQDVEGRALVQGAHGQHGPPALHASMPFSVRRGQLLRCYRSRRT